MRTFISFVDSFFCACVRNAFEIGRYMKCNNTYHLPVPGVVVVVDDHDDDDCSTTLTECFCVLMFFFLFFVFRVRFFISFL